MEKKNNLDPQYNNLLKDILENGIKKQTRNGEVLSVFGRQFRHKMSDGFPLLTGKKMFFKGIVTELLWFLRGDTNIKYLVDNDCHIWNGDAYKRYANSHRTSGNPNGKTLLEQLDSVEPIQHSKESFIQAIKTDDEFAKKWGELGPIYGKQWRSWGGRNVVKYDLENVKSSEKEKVMEQIINGGFINGKHDIKVTHQNNSIDQIQNLINDLKTNPDSRRLMVNAWNVGELNKMVLPPCHYGFQVYTRELSKNERMDYWFKNNKPNRDVCDSVDESSEGEQHKYFDGANVPKRAISLMWNQRSVDTFLGLPFNIASYALLLEILAKEVNMVPEDLIGNLGDTHLYLNHIEQAKEQINRTPYDLPTLKIEDEVKWNEGDCLPFYKIEHFTVEGYQSHPTIKAPLNN